MALDTYEDLRDTAAPPGRPLPVLRDLQRTAQLALATVWLVDAILQLQSFMFTPGKDGFSGMLANLASGNPGWIASTITWNAGVVQHHPVLTNSVFAIVQFAIGLGMAGRRTLRPALALSIVWALGVWWFGEGLGGILAGGASPLGGGPGAVLFYALLAVLLWPSDGDDSPFVAARTIGAGAARAVWVGVWVLLAGLAVFGTARDPGTLRGLVTAMSSGQPGWEVRLDRFSASLLGQHGLAVAVVLAVACLLVAASAFGPPGIRKVGVAAAVVGFLGIWVLVEDFGGILLGGATDPNSGPVVALLALCYWPIASRPDRTVRRVRIAGGCA